MNPPPAADATAALRRLIYRLFVLITTAMMLAKIVVAERVYEPSLHRAEKKESFRGSDPWQHPRAWPKERPEPTPMYSSNDRSRWATVKMLVEERTFVIGRRVENPASPKGFDDEGIIFRNDFGSVDKVLDPRTKLFYSSKPPLLTVLVAGEYALLYELLDWRIDEQRWPVVCTILITFNVVPFVVMLWLFAGLLEAWPLSDWTRVFVFASACFGTFLTTFASTLNNHTPAAFCAFFALRPLIHPGIVPSGGTIFRCGFWAGLTACLDLPAASFTAGLGVWLLLLRRGRALVLAYLPGVLIPLAGLLVANVAALGTVVPAYAYFGSEWYEYPGSHWEKKPGVVKTGIDWADEPKHVYALHNTIGHHGLFSLTPIWLLSLGGMVVILWGGLREGAVRRLFVGATSEELERPGSRGLLLHGLTLSLLGILLIFVITRTNNYGGWTSGPRWMFWLTPLLLLTMIPAVEKLSGSRFGCGLMLLMLAVAAFSAAYPVWNPWRHPWLYQLCEVQGWLRY